MKTKPVKKEKNCTVYDQNEFKERLTKTINKQLKNSLNVVSYKEILNEGMTVESFWEVINNFKKIGWNIKIKEFDIELS